MIGFPDASPGPPPLTDLGNPDQRRFSGLIRMVTHHAVMVIERESEDFLNAQDLAQASGSEIDHRKLRG